MLLLSAEFSSGETIPYPDFNGDGYADLAIGSPSEDVGTTAEDAGAVNVIYGSASGLSATAAKADQVWSQASGGINDEPQAGDMFGTSLAAGDFNGDGYSDLAIGVPGEDNDAGAAAVIYGSSEGLKSSAGGDGTGRSDQLWSQSSSGIEDSSEADDSFGQSLVAGDFNGDGYDDLAIGVPGESVTGISAGGASVIYGSSSGLSASAARADQLVTQAGSDNESGDLFGWSLVAGDFDNDGRDDLAIGAPGEDAGGITDSGVVHVLPGSAAGLVADAASREIFAQGAGGIEDTAEAGDEFASSLAAGDFNGDGYDDLAVGAPLQDIVNAGDNAGAVNVIYGSSVGLSASAAGDGTGRGDQYWHQFDPSETPASSQADVVIQHPAAQLDDQYGSSLA
ncbi:MAG TPA: FG-GAP repeat protein, partial [Nitrososphaera sp.]|nr:FG-GAP repeat protein [Nitrososphaera sp.]